MARTRQSAKQAGATFERRQADWLKANGHPYCDRRTLSGSSDKGDLVHVELAPGVEVAAELKDYGGRLEAGPWIKELEAEMENLGTEYGIIIAKRRGVSDPGKQWVISTVDNWNRQILYGRK